jgi:hypothetical protein
MSSPTRSNLVSKRLHGPKFSSGGGGSGGGREAGRRVRRETRKTVPFDERCDLVDFDAEDEDDDTVEHSEDEEGEKETSLDQSAGEGGEVDEDADHNTEESIIEEKAPFFEKRTERSLREFSDLYFALHSIVLMCHESPCSRRHVLS